MEIKNLKTNQTANLQKIEPAYPNIYYLITAIFAIFVAFWASRFLPSGKTISSQNQLGQIGIVSPDKITNINDVKTGQTYGNTNGNFKDTATGFIRNGSINGVGTHILERDGGPSQRASLTSSVLDLDLFVDRKVVIRGETNNSDKSSWLLDVGSIEVLE